MALPALLGVGAIGGGIITIGGMAVAIPMLFRKVVPTNSVHIIQRRKATIPYGRDQELGNVYYKWPSWVPVIGITRIVLPTSIFDIDLDSYDAYDVGKVPFQVDIKAFFKVDSPETAAQRVESFEEMKGQLADILRGAIRSILASAEIETIMEGRGEFGEMFTKEVEEQLIAWGVSTVKNIEFMDIRDSQGSNVIANIMAKKQSAIEKDSRVEVAGNKKDAQVAEINAVKEADVVQQEADLLVGQKTATKDKEVGIANEKAKQEIQEEARLTAEKDMAVLKVQQEKQASIDKNVAEIQATQEKEVKRLDAEAVLIEKEREADAVVVNADAVLAEKQRVADAIKITAEATLVEQQRDAEGITAVGDAKASAARALNMADVEPQIALNESIGANEPYMQYLLGNEGLKVGETVGVAKADALSSANLKVIANAGSPEQGVDKLMDIFSTQGGTAIGGMLEAMAQTDKGKELLDKITGKKTVGA